MLPTRQTPPRFSSPLAPYATKDAPSGLSARSSRVRDLRNSVLASSSLASERTPLAPSSLESERAPFRKSPVNTPAIIFNSSDCQSSRSSFLTEDNYRERTTEAFRDIEESTTSSRFPGREGERGGRKIVLPRVATRFLSFLAPVASQRGVGT